MGQQNLTTSSQNTLTGTAQNALNTALGRTLSAANGPNYYASIGPQPVAGFNPTMINAQGGLYGGAAYQPQMVTAGNVTGYAGGTGAGGLSANGMNLSGYMNPYVQNVVNSQVALEKQQDGQQQQQLIGNMTTAGAFGGDRSALAQSSLAGQQALANNATNAGLYQQGFQTAQQLAEADLNRQLQAGTAQAQLGLQAGQGNQFAGIQGANLNLAANNLLWGTGLQAQQTDQNIANARYANQLAQAQFPYQQSQFLTSGVGGLLGYNAGQTQTQPGPSTVGQIAGLGTAAAGLSGLLFGNNGQQQGGGSGLLGAVGNGVSWLGNQVGNLFSGGSGLGLGDVGTATDAVGNTLGGNTLGSGLDTLGNWLDFARGGLVDPPGGLGGYADGGTVGGDDDVPWVNADGSPMTEDQASWNPANPGTNADGDTADAVLATLRASPTVMAAVDGPTAGVPATAAQPAPVAPVASPPPPATAAPAPVASQAASAPSTTAAGLLAPGATYQAPPAAPAASPAPAAPMPRVEASANPAAPLPQPGLPLSATGGQPLGNNGSPSWALPVLAAGLGMMASRSPFAGNAIGQGGLAGLQQYMEMPRLGLAQQQLRGATMANDLMAARMPALMQAYSGIAGGNVGGLGSVGGSMDPGSAAVRDIAMRANLAFLADPTSRTYAMLQAQLNTIAKTGRVTSSDGNIYAVPGGMQGIAAAAAAGKWGEVAPALAQATGNANIDIQKQAALVPVEGARQAAVSANTTRVIGPNEVVIPPGFMPTLGASESGNNPNAGNPVLPNGQPASTASGQFQFTDQTWLSTVGKHAPQLMQGRTPEQVLALRSDPTISAQMATDYAQDNAVALQGAGLPVVGASLALAHRFGPGGATAILNANPNTPIGNVVGADVMRANPDLAGQTVGSVVMGFKSKFGVQPVSFGRPSVPNAQPAQTPQGGTPGVVVQHIPGGGVTVANTAPQQNEQYEGDLKDVGEMSDSLQKAQSDQARLLELRSLIDNSKPGQNGELRAGISNWAETYLPTAAAKALEKKIGQLPDAASAQEFAKLALQEAGDQERGTLGARGSLGAITLFTKSNPSLNMQPSADRGIINARLIGHQMDNDYILGAQAWVNQHGQDWIARRSNYAPLSQYDEQWNAQRNPQVGFAAMQAVNGVPFNQWSQGLSKPEGMRALQLIYRADPSATVLGEDGKPWPVSRFVAGQQVAQQ